MESDENLQLYELELLKAIFEDDLDCSPESLNGTITVCVSLPQETLIKLVLSNDKVLRESVVSHVAPIILRFLLPEGYPFDTAPVWDISSPLIEEKARTRLLREFQDMWEARQSPVLFDAVEELKSKLEFLVLDTFGCLVEVFTDPSLYDSVVGYDKQIKHKNFCMTTFSCAICQLELKGDRCVEFESCRHVYCRECLNNFYSSLISRGEVERIHCPDTECSKAIFTKREQVLGANNLLHENFNFEIFKSELMTHPIKVDVLQSILGLNSSGKQLVQKYMKLFIDHQHMLIAKLFPHRLVACPRKGCSAMIFREDMLQRLVICRTCDYAFCHICRKSYHSDSIDCTNSRKNQQYLGVPIEALEKWLQNDDSRERDDLRYKFGFEVMQKMSNEYLMDKLFNELLSDESQDFSKCPTCDLVIQRMDGCNKMRCSACYSFFCNVCGVYLELDRPYEHFNDKGSPCYGKLFHGMPGMDQVA